MACRNPITIRHPKAGQIQVACKQCLPCRITKQSSLALRCILENNSSLSGEFWTLTYADAPDKLDYSDFSKFMKRYRTHNQRSENPIPIRFLGCGEYGSKTGRAHFHALLWNGLPRPEKVSLTRLWPHGFVYIGTVTPSSIRYTARYTLKFQAKGEEAHASWSTKPPLGDDGMRQIARYMADRGDRLKEPPTHMSIEGSSYALDTTMQNIFQDEFEKNNDKTLRHRSPHTAHLEWAKTMLFGDPIEAERKRKAEQATFYESARLIHERL